MPFSREHLKSWAEAAMNILYPPICRVCESERATAAEGFVCANCWSGGDGVRFVVPPFCSRCGLPFEGEITIAFECSNCLDMDLHFLSARSAVLITPMVLNVIHQYKYNRALWFEPFLADLLIRQAEPVLRCEPWDLIVPVPLYPVKHREREFNQAEELAKHLSVATGIPVNKKLLRRVQPTRTQTQLTREERAANVRNAFTMNGEIMLNGERIIVLDDVFTTGATTNACARVLREAGAGDVCVWTVARGR